MPKICLINCELVIEFIILLSSLFESLKVNYVSYANYRKKKNGRSNFTSCLQNLGYFETNGFVNKLIIFQNFLTEGI